jgi:chitodextrinase
MMASRAVWTGIGLVWFLLCGPAAGKELVLSAVAAEPSETEVTISYTTNLPASGTVEYGPSDAYEHGAIVDARLTREHSVRLVGLSPGVRYHYRVSAIDAAGHTVNSGDHAFATRSIDGTPPVVGNLSVAAADTGATIRWETNEPTTGSLVYGQTDAYEAGAVTAPRPGLRHRVRLQGLNRGTEYRFRLVASDESGNAAEVLHAFSTSVPGGERAEPNAPTDVTPPVIFNLRVMADGAGATVAWETDEPATSEVAFGRSRAYGDGRVGQSRLVREHRVRLCGVSPGVTYHYQVVATDRSGNDGNSPDLTFTASSQSVLAQGRC